MKKSLILLISALLLGGCTNEPAPVKEQSRFNNQTLDAGFDTVISLIAYADDQEMFNEYFNLVRTEFKRYNALFDKYNDYEGINNIKTINDNAGIQPVKVDAAIIEMLELSKQFSDISNNKFDITMGPVLEIWHEYREAGIDLNTEGQDAPVPSMDELEAAKACVGWNNVEINEEESTVYLNQECASLDVGSVAKGFTAEKVAQELEAKGVTSGILNAGGNVRVIGIKPDGSAWNAGIQVPDLNGINGTLGVLPLSGKQSLVTSGDYQRYYISNGELMHHIIDPDTLFPARHSRALSIVTDNSGVADICSTLLYTMDYEEANEMVQKIRNLGYSLSVVWVYNSDDEIPEGKKEFKYLDYIIVTTDDIEDIFTVSK